MDRVSVRNAALLPLVTVSLTTKGSIIALTVAAAGRMKMKMMSADERRAEVLLVIRKESRTGPEEARKEQLRHCPMWRKRK